MSAGHIGQRQAAHQLGDRSFKWGEGNDRGVEGEDAPAEGRTLRRVGGGQPHAANSADTEVDLELAACEPERQHGTKDALSAAKQYLGSLSAARSSRVPRKRSESLLRGSSMSLDYVALGDPACGPGKPQARQDSSEARTRPLTRQPTGSDVSASIRLVDEGLARRANTNADARGVVAALTDAGAARRTEIAPVHAVIHAEGAPAPMTAIAREIVSQALPDFSDNDIGAIVGLYRRSQRDGPDDAS